MNLNALAEKDLAITLEDVQNGGGREFVLVEPSGGETALNGIVGDIGYLLDVNGCPIAGRSITACFRMASFTRGGDYVVPGEGWKVRYKDMAAQEWELFVKRAEPDRALGVCRLILSLDLDLNGNGANGV